MVLRRSVLDKKNNSDGRAALISFIFPVSDYKLADTSMSDRIIRNVDLPFI